MTFPDENRERSPALFFLGNGLKYSRIISAVAREPWAIDQDKALVIVSFLAQQAAGTKFSAEEVARKIGAPEARNIRKKSGGVAIIPLHGVMSQRISMIDEMSGGVSTDAVRAKVNAAAADDAVKAIILHVDSPGGSVYGTAELAAAVRKAREVKPVIAQVDSSANSAAYWVASQATEIAITPGGDAGNIGILTLHNNIAKALEMEGVDPTLIYAGEHKVELNPFGPLADSAKEHLQARVDQKMGEFLSAVASGRGTTTKDVQENFGKGRSLSAKDAEAVGMVDRIATFDETLERYARPSAGGTNRGHQARINQNFAGAL